MAGRELVIAVVSEGSCGSEIRCEVRQTAGEEQLGWDDISTSVRSGEILVPTSGPAPLWTAEIRACIRTGDYDWE